MKGCGAKAETFVNAFTMLMIASKAKLCVPAKYNVMQPNTQLKLKNVIINWLSENILSWESAYSETNNRTFVNTLAEVLWYSRK